MQELCLPWTNACFEMTQKQIEDFAKDKSDVCKYIAMVMLRKQPLERLNSHCSLALDLKTGVVVCGWL